MAWIQFHNSKTRAYHDDEYMPADYSVTGISEEGVVQVTADVAESLVEDAGVADYYDN